MTMWTRNEQRMEHRGLTRSNDCLHRSTLPYALLISVGENMAQRTETRPERYALTTLSASGRVACLSALVACRKVESGSKAVRAPRAGGQMATTATRITTTARPATTVAR